MKISEYECGDQDALRAAITWLHAEANRMGDPHVRSILNTAAFGLGSEYSNEAAKPVSQTGRGQNLASLIVRNKRNSQNQ